MNNIRVIALLALTVAILACGGVDGDASQPKSLADAANRASETLNLAVTEVTTASSTNFAQHSTLNRDFALETAMLQAAGSKSPLRVRDGKSDWFARATANELLQNSTKVSSTRSGWQIDATSMLYYSDLPLQDGTQADFIVAQASNGNGMQLAITIRDGIGRTVTRSYTRGDILSNVAKTSYAKEVPYSRNNFWQELWKLFTDYLKSAMTKIFSSLGERLTKDIQDYVAGVFGVAPAGIVTQIKDSDSDLAASSVKKVANSIEATPISSTMLLINDSLTTPTARTGVIRFALGSQVRVGGGYQ